MVFVHKDCFAPFTIGRQTVLIVKFSNRELEGFRMHIQQSHVQQDFVVLEH